MLEPTGGLRRVLRPEVLQLCELADLLPDPDSPRSTAQAAEDLAKANGGTPVKKGLGVDVTPP